MTKSGKSLLPQFVNLKEFLDPWATTMTFKLNQLRNEPNGISLAQALHSLVVICRGRAARGL